MEKFASAHRRLLGRPADKGIAVREGTPREEKNWIHDTALGQALVNPHHHPTQIIGDAECNAL